MAKEKTWTLEEVDKASKNLKFPDQILHWQNYKEFMESLEKQLTEEKEEKEDKLLKIKNLGK